MGRVEAWGVAIQIAKSRPLTGVGFDAMVQPPASIYMRAGAIPHVAHSVWFEPLADHGLPGFAIFVAIGAVGLFQARAIRRWTRSRPEWAWAHDLAIMSELSLVGYFAAGSFLSMPYYDVYFAIIAILSGLRGMVSRAQAASLAAPVDYIGNARLVPNSVV